MSRKEEEQRLFKRSKYFLETAEYPRTHSVMALLEILLKVVDENKKGVIKGILEKYLMELSVLKDAYITSIYVMRDFSRQEAERLV